MTVSASPAKRMIFHHPLPLPSASTSGSRVRPLQLLAAFQDVGYEVTVVAGEGAERHAAIRTIQAAVAAGAVFDFVYVEPPNAPLLWLNRRQPARCQEYSFWRWCRSQGIPVGLFYRDLHWRFPQFKAVTAWHKRAILRPLYWLDWLSFYGCVDHLFLPSLAMAAHLPAPWPAARRSALPPGCTIAPAQPPKATAAGAPLQLFYVGGVQPPLYDLKPMFTAVAALSGVRLTVCCRPEEWAIARAYYEPFDATKIHIVHAHGAALGQYYTEADLFGLIWQPSTYLDFAMPVKVFEALGYGVPLVTTAGTEAARFVANVGIGWVVDNQAALCELLARLRDQPGLVAEQRRRVAEVRHRHTWQVRAQTVIDQLTTLTHDAPAVRPVAPPGGRRTWATED